MFSLLLALTTNAQAENKTYVDMRGSMAVPANARGFAYVGSVGVGSEFEAGGSLGLRFLGMADPPSTMFSQNPAQFAGGPVLDWRKHIYTSDDFDLYPAVSGGFVITVDQPTGRNIVLPVLETGFGVRKSFGEKDGTRFALSPEIGFVPFLLAPYGSITMSTIF
jgi:hypothetical protein